MRCAKGDALMIPGESAKASDMVFLPHRNADPDGLYEYYERFRAAGRVARGDSAGVGGDTSLALLRFQDVLDGLRDGRLGKEWQALLPPGDERPAPPPNTFGDIAHHFMLFRDPPDHTRLRSTANMAFTPRH